MKIAIDLNDVLRDYSNNFLKYYIDRYNHEYDLSDFEFFSNDMKLVFPFQNDESYYKFIYEDFSFELYAKCPTCSNSTQADLKGFANKVTSDVADDNSNELSIISTKEYGSTIGCTYFFLSKLAPNIREVYLPSDSMSLWDKYDVIITANPDIMAMKPEGKICVKIKTDYNKDADADYEFSSFRSFCQNEEIISKITD